MIMLWFYLFKCKTNTTSEYRFVTRPIGSSDKKFREHVDAFYHFHCNMIGIEEGNSYQEIIKNSHNKKN